MRAGIVAVASLGLLVAVTGCSSDKAVEKDKLQSTVKSTLEKKVGQKAKGVTCPDDLKAKVGTKTRCTLEAMDGTKFGVNVTVTSVDGNDVKYDIKVDDQPM
jgi:uncharacterized protein DUF4333